MTLLVRSLLVAALVLGGLQSVAAQETRWTGPPAAIGAPKQPDDPTAAKAFAVLDRACAQCHQTGKLSVRAAGRGFSNVLDLEAVARDGTLVRPGNPDGSRLYVLMQTRIAPHDSDAAGKDLALSGTDLDAVRDWISGLKPTSACTDRAVVTAAETSRAMQQALAAAPVDAAPSIRFLSLTHIHNSCAATADMAAYRYAAVVALNSLSWGLKPIVLDTIDPAESVLRVDLKQLGWDAARWDRLVANYPYAALDAAPADLQRGSPARISVRADWFAASALKPPLYYDLLGLPDRLSTLQSSLRIDPATDFALNRARRLGLKSSQVARGSRLLQRHAFANGAFWTSFEYAPTPGRPDLFDAPGGPGSRGASKPDASLSMFSLPSGYNAFFMTNGDGLRVNDVPQSVVRNDSHPSLRVAAGAGCFACHGRGVLPATDELRARVQGDTAIPRDIREKVLALHGAVDETQKLFAEDSGRLAGAVAESGLVPGVTLDGVDPVAALVQRYERDVTLDALALELELPTEKLRAAAAQPTGLAADLLHRIVHGPVPRSLIEAQMSGLLEQLTGRDSGPVVLPVTPIDSDRIEPAQLILKTGPTEYKTGEAFTLRVRTTQTCYLTLINIDRNGRGTVVFPNDFEPTNYLEAGKELKVPADGAPYIFRLREPGRETVVGVCQTVNKSPPGIRHDFERQRFTELGDYRAFLNRSAANEPENRAAQNRPNEARLRRRGVASAPQTPAPVAPVAAAKSETQLRAAVQIDILP
jgi:Domain of unknown function (DUF4384)